MKPRKRTPSRERHRRDASPAKREHTKSSVKCSKVTIAVRVRPPHRMDGDCSRLVAKPQAHSVVLLPTDDRQPTRTFNFDAVFGPGASQADVYRATAAAGVHDVMRGHNACVLAYGQTGAGKTYTTFGPAMDVARVTASDASLLGLIPRAVHDLFERIEMRHDDFVFKVSVSYYQVYMNVVQDLLADYGLDVGDATAADLVTRGLTIRETTGGTFVEGLTAHVASDVYQVMALLEAGARNKAVNVTALNRQSSRAHTLFAVTVEREMVPLSGGDDGSFLSSPLPPSFASRTGRHLAELQRPPEDALRLSARLTFVDLAGSERTSKTGAEGVTLKEASAINKSLTALGNVVSALSAAAGKAARGHLEKAFVPWRDSKLTRLLEPCLAGRSTVVVMLALSPSERFTGESLSTLLFGQRARSMQMPHTPEEDYRALALRLRQELDAAVDRQRTQTAAMVSRYDSLQEANNALYTRCTAAEGRVAELEVASDRLQQQLEAAAMDVAAAVQRANTAELAAATLEDALQALSMSHHMQVTDSSRLSMEAPPPPPAVSFADPVVQGVSPERPSPPAVHSPPSNASSKLESRVGDLESKLQHVDTVVSSLAHSMATPRSQAPVSASRSPKSPFSARAASPVMPMGATPHVMRSGAPDDEVMWRSEPVPQPIKSPLRSPEYVAPQPASSAWEMLFDAHHRCVYFHDTVSDTVSWELPPGAAPSAVASAVHGTDWVPCIDETSRRAYLCHPATGATRWSAPMPPLPQPPPATPPTSVAMPVRSPVYMAPPATPASLASPGVRVGVSPPPAAAPPKPSPQHAPPPKPSPPKPFPPTPAPVSPEPSAPVAVSPPSAGSPPTSAVFVPTPPSVPAPRLAPPDMSTPPVPANHPAPAPLYGPDGSLVVDLTSPSSASTPGLRPPPPPPVLPPHPTMDRLAASRQAMWDVQRELIATAVAGAQAEAARSAVGTVGLPDMSMGHDASTRMTMSQLGASLPPQAGGGQLQMEEALAGTQTALKNALRAIEESWGLH